MSNETVPSAAPEETIIPMLMDDVLAEQYEQARTRLTHLSRGQLRSLHGILRDAEWVVSQAIEENVLRAIGRKPEGWAT